MTRARRVLLGILTVLLFAVMPHPLSAQTASSATIVGTITDPSGAAVPGAKVALHNVGTNAENTATTTAQGTYTFPNVAPGSYSISVEAQGFQKATVSGLNVQVAESYTVNTALKVGNMSQTVQVTAAPAVALETTNAQVGNALGATDLQRLPTLQHNAGELVEIQPGVTSNPAGGATGGGARVTGAMDDQNTITLNGIDITDNAMLSNDNGFRTMVPIPGDAVQEFRVGVTNEDATYGRSGGAQVALAARRGSNDWHGAAYWYTQNSVLNANTWDNNRVGITKPSLRDNRFGGRVGGPIVKNKTFFFLNYEGRRFPQQLPFSELVPTSTLRQGILRFRDASGNINSYNLASSTLCGNGSQACDPRGLGISPTISQMWSMMPSGNNSSLGDGLNTVGYTSNVPAPLTDNFYMARLDQKITSKWQFNGMFIYDGNSAFDAIQLNVTNPNRPVSSSFNPVRSNFISASVTGQITPTLSNNFRFGYVRDRNGFVREDPSSAAKILNLKGTNTADGPVAISTTNGTGGTSPVSGALLDEPIDMYTGEARTQLNDNKDIQWVDDFIKTRGNHTIHAGVQLRYLPSQHQRNDKVVGSLASLEATLDADVTSNISSIPAADRPPTCKGSIATNCITSGNVQAWDRLYAVTLGLVDNVGILTARDGNLNPLPFGTPLVATTHQWTPYFYAMDTWRFRPSLTLNYGISYGWQTAPTEKLGRQTVEINTTTGQELTAPEYQAARIAAARQGSIFNPQVGYLPVKTGHVPIYNTDWGNVAPRVGLAYNPSFNGGLLGKAFGSRKTVFRGGFGIYYDRVNTVQSVVIPMLGVGFGQTISVLGPNCAATGPGGVDCNSTSSNPAASAFRVGQDGTIPVPTLSKVTAPVVPAVPFGETLSFQDDPNFKTGRSYNADFTIQRELPAGLLLEVGWAGRWSRDLAESVNLNQAPYFMVDSKSGQTFAQAFDTVASEVRNNEAVTPQPWFEDMAPKLSGGASCPAATNNTQCLATSSASSFINGLVSSLFNTIDGARLKSGLPTIINRQTQIQEMRTYKGLSNYQGLLVSLRKQTSRGLSLDVNYTLSRALDDGILNEDSAGYYANSYFPTASYGPTNFDEKHVLNADFFYDFPAGRGHSLHFNNSVLDKIISGWYMSGIFSAYSGLPLTMIESSQVWGNGLVLAPNTAMIPTANLSTGVVSNVTGSNGIGTNGNPSSKGSGLNLFSDPAAAYDSFQPVLISQDGRDGRTNPLRGLPFWNLDYSLGKETTIREQLKASYAFYFFNLFNHPNFTTPGSTFVSGAASGLSFTSPQSFGVITSTLTPANRPSSSRWIEFTFRLEF